MLCILTSVLNKREPWWLLVIARWKPRRSAVVRLIFILILADENWVRGQTNSFPEFHLEAARDYLQSISRLVEKQVGTNVEAQFINARLESQLGQKPEAERLARLALLQDPKRTDIQVFLADIFIRQDRLDDAAKVLRQALQTDPQSKGVHRRLGMVLERLGEIAIAQAAFETAARINPDDALARVLLGRMFSNQGKVAAAEAEFERASQLDPKSANAYYGLFQCQTKVGKQETAQKSLQIFRELKKQERSAMEDEDVRSDENRDLRAFAAGFHDGIANQLFQQGQEELAESHLRQALIIAPQDSQALEILATYYIRKERLLEAKPLLIKLVGMRPQAVDARLNLVTLLLQLKDSSSAIPELNKVLDLDPKQPQALYALARAYLGSRQQLPEALSLSQRLIVIQPAAINYDLLGWAYYANGQTNEALQASAHAVEKDPTNSIYRHRYERLKQATGTRP